MEVEIYKSEFYKTPLFFGSNSAMCPICSVISNIYPCYDEGETTSVPHRLTYCDHELESKSCIMVAGEPKQL